MANIANELTTIAGQRLGEGVRTAIHDSIQKINGESDQAKTAAITASDSIRNLDLESQSAVTNINTKIEQANDMTAEMKDIYDGIVEWPKVLSIDDENGDPIKDENGNPIEGTVIFLVRT